MWDGRTLSASRVRHPAESENMEGITQMFGMERDGDVFPVGTNVRVDVCSYGHARGGTVGRIVDSNGRTVRTVRFTDGTDSFHTDHLLPVRYAHVRMYGPGMTPNRSEFLGTRYVVTGRRGDRFRLTVPADHAMTPTDNMETAVIRYARERLGMCDPSAESWQDWRTGGRVYAITDHGTCQCSDEFGPCEWHADTLVIREGSSVRTADELQHEFLTDVASACSAWPSDEFERDTIRIGNALADNRSDYGTAWLSDGNADGSEDFDNGYTWSELLGDLVGQAETFLASHGLTAVWEDGYRIVRITGGPFAR